MKFNLYSIYDSKVGKFGTIFTMSDDVSAIRQFQLVVNSPEYEYFYQDLQLNNLGSFDSETGEIVQSIEMHNPIVYGKDIKRNV